MLQRILAQAGDLATFALTALMFGMAKAILIPSTDSWKHQIASLFIAVIVGTMAGALAMQQHWGDYSCIMASSVASLLSRDIIMAILNNRCLIGDLIKQAATNIVQKWTT